MGGIKGNLVGAQQLESGGELEGDHLGSGRHFPRRRILLARVTNCGVRRSTLAEAGVRGRERAREA